MAVQTISYANKSYINQNSSIAATNKIQDTDMNEIKSVVNNNATELTNIKGAVLWTNPNPTSDFSSQTITLSSSDYDLLEFIYMEFNSNNQVGSVKVKKGYNTRLTTALGAGTVYTRSYEYVSDTSYTIGSTTNGGGNSNLYPLYVIGYKLGIF